MKKFAKLLAMVLAVSMVLTMFVGAFDYVDAAAIDEDKAAAVKTVYEAGIMMGNNKGEFNAKANLTRDEMAKIMFALASYEQKADDVYSVYASVSFADYANIPAWSKSYVGFAAYEGIVVGDAKGNANALGTLSYVEAAIMLMRTLGLEGTYDHDADATTPEIDAFTGAKWYQNAVLVAYMEGLFDDLDIADYKAAITREDVAVMIANAMDHANAAYATAYAINDTIVGTTKVENEDGEEVEILVFLNGSVEEDILAEGYEDAIFHEVYAVVEGDEILDIEVVEPIFEGEVLKADIELVEEEDEDENVYYNLVIEGEVVVEDFDAADFAIITSDGFEAAASYDYVTIIINENTIFGDAAPVQFKYFVENEWAPEEDYKDNTWTGEFYVYVDGVKYDVAAAYADVELEGMYSFQIVDGEIVNIKAVKAVSVYDLDTKYDAKKDEYTVSYKGVEINDEYVELDEQAVWAEQLVATEEISGVEVEDIVVYLYNDYVFVDYEVIYVEEEEEEETETVYGFVTGFDAELKITEDDEKTEDKNEYKIEWIITVDAVVKGEAKQFVYVQEQDEVVFAKPAYVEYAFAAFELDAEGKTVGTPVETAIATYAIESIADGKLNGAEFKGEFYDYTGSELTFADLSYEVKDGKITFKAGGKRVSANFIAAYEYADVIVVVFDAAEEDRFGAYGEIAE